MLVLTRKYLIDVPSLILSCFILFYPISIIEYYLNAGSAKPISFNTNVDINIDNQTSISSTWSQPM